MYNTLNIEIRVPPLQSTIKRTLPSFRSQRINAWHLERSKIDQQVRLVKQKYYEPFGEYVGGRSTHSKDFQKTKKVFLKLFVVL